jgi:hypothetical protein
MRSSVKYVVVALNVESRADLHGKVWPTALSDYGSTPLRSPIEGLGIMEKFNQADRAPVPIRIH